MTDQELISALLYDTTDTVRLEAAKRLRLYSRIERAWNDPGRFPVYHERAKDKLRERWPALSNPLDVL